MVDFNNTALGEAITYSTFGCNVFSASPQTPDMVPAVQHIYRHGAAQGSITAPDGRVIPVWSLLDSSGPRTEWVWTHPSPTIRVTEDRVVHTHLTTDKGPHTIHHHGIEPTTMNDGVGHVSFEVDNSYTYQWQPRESGTFFYHCHRNTTLHFEMGMFGFLIVDPPPRPEDLDANGNVLPNAPKRLNRNVNSTYDVEALWVADDMDPRWHDIADHDAGLCGMDVGLNRFEPKYFLLSGVFNDKTMLDPRTKVVCKAGQRVLIRLLNASYSVLRVRFPIDVVWVGCDGHAMGRDPWCGNRLIPAGQPIELCTAQRYDIFMTPPTAGSYPVTMEFRNWITGRIQDDGKGVLRTRIIAR